MTYLSFVMSSRTPETLGAAEGPRRCSVRILKVMERAPYLLAGTVPAWGSGCLGSDLNRTSKANVREGLMSSHFKSCACAACVAAAAAAPSADTKETPQTNVPAPRMAFVLTRPSLDYGVEGPQFCTVYLPARKAPGQPDDPQLPRAPWGGSTTSTATVSYGGNLSGLDAVLDREVQSEPQAELRRPKRGTIPST
jgi:hypothetical protein